MIVAVRASSARSAKPRSSSSISTRSISAAASGASRWRRAATSANRPRRSTLEEGALLAGMPKGPNYYNPDRYPDRAQERLAYVLSRMKEEGVITRRRGASRRSAEMPRLVDPRAAARATPASTFVDHLKREAKDVRRHRGPDGAAPTPCARPSTRPAAGGRDALQEGLARYELEHRARQQFHGAEANLGDADPAASRRRQRPSGRRPDGSPAWQQALESARLPLYDVHWPLAVVLERAGPEGRRRGAAGRPRRRPHRAAAPGSAAIRRSLKLYDVVLVRRRRGARARRPARRAAGAAARCRARRSCWRTRPAASWRWRAASPIR